ncbi:MAG: hypothetical protein DRJ10_17170, partial [Bacteroidetes bacterium]
MKKIFLHILLLFPFLVNSQNDQIDSLTKLLNTTETDSVRIELLIKLSYNLPKKDSVLKYSYANKALHLSKKEDVSKYQAIAKKNMAAILQAYNKNAEAVPYYESAILLFQKNRNKVEEANINYELGRIFYRLDSFQESINFHQKSLSIRKRLNDTKRMMESEQALGIMFWRLGNLENAEKHFLIAIPLAEKNNDTQSILSILNNLGAIHWGFSNYNLALEYYEKALKIAIETDNKRKYALIINNIGLIYREWGKNDKALENYLEGLKVSKKDNYLYGTAYSHSNIGKIYLLKNEYKKALLNFDSALINYNKISKKIGIAFSYCNIGDSYLGMKDFGKAIYHYKLSVKTAREVNSQHHLALGLYALANANFEGKSYNLAEIIANESLQISINQKYQKISKDNYFLLSKLAEISGSANESLKYFKKASVLKDSIFNEKSSKQFAEMQTKYETEKKELLLSKQQELINKNDVIIKQNKMQKYGLSTILLFMLVFIVYVLKTRKKLKQKNIALKEKYEEIEFQNNTLEQQKKKIEKINKELLDLTKLKEINTQMIVHDLKNPLNRIISTSKSKKTEADRKLYESSQYMLNLVENILSVAKIKQKRLTINKTAINLEEIILDAFESTEFLFKNKGVLFEKHIPINYKVLAENDILKRIFINLFTNAIKYTPSGGKITVLVKRNNDFAVIEVKDTGIGIKKEKLTKIFEIYEQDNISDLGKVSSTGIGLFFVKNAIKALDGKILVKSEHKIGTSFIITLKIIKHIKKTKTELNSKINENLQLDANEKEHIKYIVKELKNTDLYEVTKIKELLSQINSDTDNLKSWLKLMNESVANYNTNLFQKLIIIA